MGADQNGSAPSERRCHLSSETASLIGLRAGRSVLIRLHPPNPLLIALWPFFMSFVPFMLFMFRLLRKQPSSEIQSATPDLACRRPAFTPSPPFPDWCGIRPHAPRSPQ